MNPTLDPHQRSTPIARTRLTRREGRWRLELVERGLIAKGADLAAVAERMRMVLRELVAARAMSSEEAEAGIGGVDDAVRAAQEPASMAAVPGATPPAEVVSPSPLPDVATTAIADSLPARGGSALPFIVGIIVGIVATWIGTTIGSFTQALDPPADSKDSGRALGGLMDSLAHFAESITPQRQQQMVEDTRTIVKRLLPFARELRPLFHETAPESAPERRKP